MKEGGNEEVENKDWREKRRELEEKIRRKYGWKGEKRGVKDTHYCYTVLLLLVLLSSSSSRRRQQRCVQGFGGKI